MTNARATHARMEQLVTTKPRNTRVPAKMATPVSTARQVHDKHLTYNRLTVSLSITHRDVFGNNCECDR